MKILDGQNVRDMTPEELTVHELNVANIAAQQQADENRVAARQSALAKLEALGLTPAEIAALVGA